MGDGLLTKPLVDHKVRLNDRAKDNHGNSESKVDRKLAWGIMMESWYHVQPKQAILVVKPKPKAKMYSRYI